MKTDLQIQKDVMDELLYEPFLNASEIGVSVHNGIVTLTGTLDTYSKKIAAGKAANRVKGTKAVALDIHVKPDGAHNLDDSALAQTILNTLKWHSAVKEDKIRVKVEDGWVTLEGEVEWEYQRSNAEYAVENILGVRCITNLIRIFPQASEADIREKIIEAFQHSATIDAERIKIENVDGTVILTGKVRSIAEKKDAAAAAWFAPGVINVDNRLEVESKVFTF